MKILKVRFCNINSLKGTHEIDFQSNPLSTAGLFAITGATGSGKTTILDVITLALYNRIPRISERISKNSISKAGLLLTRNMPEGYAEVLYECSKGAYRSKWSISSTRNGTLRDYEMEIAQEGSGKLMDVQRRDVPDKNSELIGLNYDQFVRAIILAQGDFATFLKSRNEERSKLLEQITGGEIYRELGRKAFEMNKLHGQELEDKKRLKGDLEGRLIPKEEFSELKNKLNEAESTLKLLNKNKESTQASIQLKKDIEQAENILVALLKEKDTLFHKLELFQSQYGEKLKKNNALIPVKDKLVEWQQENKKAEETSQRIAKIESTITELKSRVNEQKTRIGKLTSDFDSSPLEALSEFERKVNEIERLIESTSIKYSERFGTLESIVGNLPFEVDLSDLNDFRKTIEMESKEFNSELINIKSKLGEELIHNPQERLIECRHAAQNIVLVLKEQEFIDQFNKDLSECQKETETVEEKAAKLPQLIKEKENQVDKLKSSLDRQMLELDAKKLSASLEDHRNHLKNGEPCPLCGSTSHPYSKIEKIEIDDLEIEVRKHQDEYQEEYGRLVNMKALADSYETRKAELAKKKTELSQDINQKELSRDSFSGKLPQRYQKGNPNEINEVLKDHIKDLERYSLVHTTVDKLSGILEQVNMCMDVNSEILQHKESRNKLYDGPDSQKEIRESRELWTSLTSDMKNSEDAKKDFKNELETTVAKSKTISVLISPVIKSLHYEDEYSAISDLLSSEEAARLYKEESDLKMQINQSETKARLIEKDLGKQKERDTETSIEDLQDKANEIQSRVITEQESFNEGKNQYHPRIKNATTHLIR